MSDTEIKKSCEQNKKWKEERKKFFIHELACIGRLSDWCLLSGERKFDASSSLSLKPNIAE